MQSEQHFSRRQRASFENLGGLAPLPPPVLTPLSGDFVVSCDTGCRVCRDSERGILEAFEKAVPNREVG